MSDGKIQEPHDFIHMWDIKQKAITNRTNKLIDTDNSVVVIRGERRWREDKEGKGHQLNGDGRKSDFG